MVSIAPEWKFTPHFDLDFASMVGRLLDDVPIAHVVVIGADPSESRWITLEDRYPFRARVIAETPNTGTYLEAADIYFDSIPFSSMTSALEGALMGIPSVTFSSDELPYLEARDFGFGSECSLDIFPKLIGLLASRRCLRMERSVIGMQKDRMHRSHATTCRTPGETRLRWSTQKREFVDGLRCERFR